MTKPSWFESWNGFIDFIADQYLAGKSDTEISDAIAGNRVRWCGRIVRKNLESRYVPGIEFDMGSHRRDFHDGNHIDQRYLYLNVSDRASWISTNLGDRVEFLAEIRKSDSRSPFLPVGLIMDKEKNAVSIKLEVHNGLRLS